MTFLASFLPILIYFLLVILIVIFIVLGYKLIIAVDKFDKIADNITDKVNSLNIFFEVVEGATTRITSVYSKGSEIMSKIAQKLFVRKRGNKDDEEE